MARDAMPRDPAPPAVPPSTTAIRAKPSRTGLILIGAAFLIMGLGFAGLDRWFYEHVSCVLNIDEYQPQRPTFYRVTKPFWSLCRVFIGHGLAALLILGYAVAVIPRRWRIVIAAILAIAVSGVAANVAQAAIGRARPNQAASALTFAPFKQFEAQDQSFWVQLFGKEGVSFPSGEAAVAAALAVVLSRLYPRWRIALYIAGTLGAVARLMNGAHYLSDVAAGAVLGGVLGLVLLRVFGRWLGAGYVPTFAALPSE